MEKPFLYTDLIPPDSTETPEDVLNVNGVIPVKMWNTGSPYKIDHLANLYLRNSVETATNESFEGMLNYISENMNFDDDNDNEDNNEKEDDNEDDEDFIDQHIQQTEEDSNYEVESNIRNYFTNDGSSQEEAEDVAYQSEEYEFDYEQPDEQTAEAEDEVNREDIVDGDYDDAGDDDDEENFEDDDEDEEDDENAEPTEDNESDDDQLVEREREMERVTAAFEDILASPRIQQYIEKKQLLGPDSGNKNLTTNSVSSGTHIEEEDDASVADDLLHIMSDYSELMTYLQSPRGDPALNPKIGGGMNSNASKSKLVRKLIADSPPQHARQQNQQFVITKEAPGGGVARQGVKKPPAGKDKKKGTNGGKPTSKAKAIPKRRQSPLTLITSGSNSRQPSSAALEEQHGLSDDEDGSNGDDFLQPVRMKPVAATKKGKTQQPVANSRAKTEAGNKLKVLNWYFKWCCLIFILQALLTDMVERRRVEEEEQILLAERAIAKRKKFKEALLEKAMKSRKIADENPDSEGNSPVPVHAHHSAPISSSAPPGFLAPTQAFKVQSVVRTAKQVALTDEDLVRAEEAKHEHIAGIRRKFKEQHKKTLMSLVNRNKEEEKKVCQHISWLTC
jgi:hypothetical protein